MVIFVVTFVPQHGYPLMVLAHIEVSGMLREATTTYLIEASLSYRPLGKYMLGSSVRG